MATRRLVRPFALINRLCSSHVPHTHAQTSSPPSRISCQARSFASPSSRSAPPSYAQVFTLSDIPLASFQGVISRNGSSFKDLSPEEYYAVAQKFSEAITRGSSPWAVPLTGKDAIPAETIHQVACIMRQITGPRSADAFATALWSTASEMGHRPSTLSLARQLIRSGAYGRIPQLRKVESRFRELVSGGKDADALTAEGELLLEQGRFADAAAALERALKRCSAFEWRPHCELCLGRAYLKMGKSDEARMLFNKVAEEGLVEADVELAEMLRSSDADEARQRLYTAACNGRRDMFTRLSEMELERVPEKEVGGDRIMWAMEWAKLADAQVEH